MKTLSIVCVLVSCCLQWGCSQGQDEAKNQTLPQAKVIPVGKGPDALFLTPDETFLYIANVEDTHISVIDTRKDSVVQIIDTIDFPWGFTRLGNSNFVAVSGWDKGIDVIDFTSHEIVRSQRYPQNLGGITSTSDGITIFVVATEESKVLKIDANSLAKNDEYQTGQGPDGIGISKDQKKIYVTNTKDGTISIININNKTRKNITVGGKPELIHANEDHSILYISNFIENKIHILSTETDQIIYEISGLDGPEEAVLSKSQDKLFVVNFNNSQILSYDAASFKKCKEIYIVGQKPIGIIAGFNDSKLYVTNYGDNTVSVIELGTP